MAAQDIASPARSRPPRCRQRGHDYWTGTAYTTNCRVWEHDEAFKERLRLMRCMAIDMETATIFAAGCANLVRVSAEFVERHIQIGIEALRLIRRHGKSVRLLRFDE